MLQRFNAVSRSKQLWQTLPLSCLFIAPTLALLAPKMLVPLLAIATLYPFYLAITQLKLLPELVISDYQKIIALFLIYAGLSIMWTIHVDEAIKMWPRLIIISLMSFVFLHYCQHQSVYSKKIVAFVVVGGLCLALLFVMIELVFNNVILKTYDLAVDSFQYETSYYNKGAVFLAMFMWPALLMLLSYRKYIVATLSTIVLFLCLTQFDSMSAIISTIVGIITFAFVLFLRSKAINIMIATLITTIFFTPLFFSISRITQLETAIPTIPTAASDARLQIWNFYAHKAGELKWFGLGLQSAKRLPATPEEIDQFNLSYYPILHPHNSTLHFWTDFGIVGLILFGLFTIVILKSIKNDRFQPYQKAALAGAFATTFTISQFAYGMWQNWWLCSITILIGTLLLTLKAT